MAELPNVTFAPAAEIRDKSLVLLVGVGGLTGFAREVDARSGGMLTRAMEAAEFKPKKKKTLEILAPSGIQASRVILAGLGDPGGLTQKDWLDLGGVIRGKLTAAKAPAGVVIEHGLDDAGDAAASFALGFALRGYEFRKYKSKHPKKNHDQAENDRGDEPPEAEAGDQPFALTIYTAAAADAQRRFNDLRAVCRGVYAARDLVNEPANILTPSEFAARLEAFRESGLEVEILGPDALRAHGMNAMLAVGQGSVQPTYAVVMRWNGATAAETARLLLIGKGVCFDTGGISIKPAQGMEEMKGDMAGAAAVAGTMLALAERKAAAHVVGIVGLVENMPSGTAQRPGDIVVSASGQTVEVLNTDAEGRLVLADLLWYGQKFVKPRQIVTLATLTGAIIVALGKEYAGLFSNDDALSQGLTEAGEQVAEGVWRLPLGSKYDKMLESKIADMKNIGGRDAGSITAAQFLQRFVDKGQAWAHLDVAGTAMASPATDINQSWGSGFGVRLLDAFIRRHYES